jgi:hypothetical protein
MPTLTEIEARTRVARHDELARKPRRRAHRAPAVLGLIVAVLAVPLVGLGQTKAPDKQLPTFSQTADAPQPGPAPSSAAPPQPAAAPPPAAASQPASADGPPEAIRPEPAPAAAPPTAVPPQPAPVAAPPAPAANAQIAPAKPRKCTWDWVRQGFYLRIMSIVGYARFGGDGPAGSARVAGLGTGSIIAIGGSLGHRLVLAGTMQATEVTGKFNGGPYAGATFASGEGAVAVTDKARVASSQLGALVDWYPLQAEGLHVGLSVGVGSLVLTNQADDSTTYGNSVAGTLLVGYDWPISPTWALGLALVASGSTRATLKKRDSGDENGYKLAPLFVGLSGSILLF